MPLDIWFTPQGKIPVNVESTESDPVFLSVSKRTIVRNTTWDAELHVYFDVEQKPAVLHDKSGFKSKVTTGVHGACNISRCNNGVQTDRHLNN